MLLHDINHEEGGGQTCKVSNGTEVLLEFSALACYLQQLALRKVGECAIVHELVYVRHFLDSLTDGGEVGEHTARPTLDDVRHVDRGSLFGYDVLGLFFSSDEQDLLATLGNALESLSSLVDLGYCLVEVDDMNAVALHEDVRSHGGVPLALQMTEMATCLKQLVKVCS